MTKTIYKILGKRGRITIPWEIRRELGFAYNDVVSFQMDGHWCWSNAKNMRRLQIHFCVETQRQFRRAERAAGRLGAGGTAYRADPPLGQVG